MVNEMVGDKVPCAYCGGSADGGLGTGTGEIKEAIEQVWNSRGVAVMVDLGGAEMNAEMAIEMLPAEHQKRVKICNAPVVEGAVMAATKASCGATLDQVCTTAEDLSRYLD